MLTLLLLSIAALGNAEEWTRFRGANGSGVTNTGSYPSEISKEKNLVWRVPVHPGKSSPVLTAKHVFLTGFENGKLFTQCFDRKTGKLLWERTVDKTRDEVANRLNHAAAITPVTDGENVYVFFKDFGFLSYDPAGNARWKTPMAPFKNTMGLGSSPILAGDLIILLADQVENSFIAAFDKRNGEMRWRVEREEAEAWGTPLLYRAAGTPMIITTSRGQFGAHLPADGKRVSTVHGLPTVVVGSPAIVDGTLYVQGYGSEEPEPFSRRLERYDKNKDGKLTPDEYGDDPFLTGIAKFKGNRDMIITEDEWNEKQKEVLGPNCLVAYRLERSAKGPGLEAKELWRYNKSFTGVIPSPLVYQGALYFVKNGGILTSLDANSGEVLKTGRLQGALGGYSSSPVAADGKVYLGSEEGKITVLRAAKEWEIISITDFGEGIYATPALSEGNLYLRTDSALYRFGPK